MSKRDRYSTSFVFVDVFLNVLLIFVIVCFCLLKIIKTEDNSGKIDDKNEFVVTATWDGKSEDDVDLWILTPTEGVVSFLKREVPGISLTNDNLGARSNRLDGANGVMPPENMETMNLRRIAPGRYVVNIHMYRKSDPTPTVVKIKLMKINPFSQIIEVNVPVVARGEEITAFVFTINENNVVTEVTREQERFIMDKTQELMPNRSPQS